MGREEDEAVGGGFRGSHSAGCDISAKTGEPSAVNASGAMARLVFDALPGYDQCGPVDVPWLSESQTQLTIPPGHSIGVTITVSPTGQQSGTYAAVLDIGNDTPYEVPALPVTMTVH